MEPAPIDLSTGLVAYLSGGSSPFPTLDEITLISVVGEDKAIAMLPRLQSMVKESELVAFDSMNRSPEPWRQVENEMRSRHPELSDEAIMALGRYWSYQLR